MEAITDKHRHILKKAEELFSEKGFDGTSVRDIADAAGINLAMISYYFGSKEKLLEALFKERREFIRLRLENILQNASLSPYQKLEFVVEEYVKKVSCSQSFYKILIYEQLLKKNAILIKVINEIKQSYFEMLDKLIKEGQKAKLFRKDIDVVMLHTTIVGTVIQAIINKDIYREYYQFIEKGVEYDEILMQKLAKQLKVIIKATVGYEESK